MSSKPRRPTTDKQYQAQTLTSIERFRIEPSWSLSCYIIRANYIFELECTEHLSFFAYFASNVNVYICEIWGLRSSWAYAQTDQGCFPSANTSLRKHAYSNILKILPPKNENFEIKIFDIFHISAQNIDCGYSLEPPWRGGSNEYPQSMLWAEIKRNNVHPCKPQFCYIKVGFKGVKVI